MTNTLTIKQISTLPNQYYLLDVTFNKTGTHLWLKSCKKMSIILLFLYHQKAWIIEQLTPVKSEQTPGIKVLIQKMRESNEHRSDRRHR